MKKGELVLIKIRKAEIGDAKHVIEVMKDAEQSGFMLFSPGERKVNEVGFSKYIEDLHKNDKCGLFIACEKQDVLGYMIVRQEKPERIAHRAYIVVGVHSTSRGKGIGRALFEHVMGWAKEQGLHRLELTVLVKNEVAVQLYKKVGFTIEGVKKDSLFVNGQYEDEYYMAKLL